MAIAAVVNEDVITMFDVQSRLAMFISTSGLENTPEMQRRLLPQVVQGLIDERLKVQEARRLKIDTTEQEVREAVTLIEQQNNMAPGTFRRTLEEQGVDMGTLYGQIEADVAWLKVVRQELRRDVNIAPEEVQAVIARLKANQGKPENQVAEIFLPVNVNARDADVRQLAERLVQQARGGTPFPALAQQFSQSPTAAVGGDLGWVLRGELEEEVDAAIARMEPNEVSDPIRTAAGYHIVVLRARRDSGAADPQMAIITMAQLYIPTVGGRAPSGDKVAEITEAVSTRAKTCDDMRSLTEQFGLPGSGPIEPLRIGMLPKDVQDVVIPLTPGRVSPPIPQKGGRLFVMLCQREDDTGLPNEEQVYARLESEKLESVARQRLRDLRRQALIDVRL
jgi:peptidyl-prolyl cis-trans isomerase SurA